jgi:hypothetical protein
MHDLEHPIICWCRKHQQLAHQEGASVAWFPLDVLMIHSSTLVVTTDNWRTKKRLTCGGFSLNETIRFGSLKFITDCFGGLTISPRGDSGSIFVGMCNTLFSQRNKTLEINYLSK